MKKEFTSQMGLSILGTRKAQLFLRWAGDFLTSILPDQAALQHSLKTHAMILLGGILLAPLVGQLPMLGWDWFFVYYGHNPDASRMYPPFARLFIKLFTWMDWRQSLGLLNALTLMTLAVATWQQGRRYSSILLALLTPPVVFLLWIGHADALVLLGALTGIIPLALIKPNITFWSLLRSRAYIAWTAIFIVATLILWPSWPARMLMASLTHEAAFGWIVTGWPVALLGLVLLLGAGNDPYRLMASGALVSPYLMPYHMAVLVPVIGKVHGYRRLLIWGSTWLLVLGVGIGGWAKYLNLVFPNYGICFNAHAG